MYTTLSSVCIDCEICTLFGFSINNYKQTLICFFKLTDSKRYIHLFIIYVEKSEPETRYNAFIHYILLMT